MSLQIGANVDVVRGSYEGERGTVTELTPQMVYVDLSSGHSVRINQTSVRVRSGQTRPVRVDRPVAARVRFDARQASTDGIFSLIDNFPIGRAFGAEYELGFPKGMRETATTLQENAGQDVQSAGYTHAPTAHWKLVSDSSVEIPGRLAGELVSPKLSGEEGLRRIESMLNAVNMLPGGGPAVNRTAGHHVHLDASRDLSLEDAKKVASAFYIFEEAFDVLMPESRQADTNDYLWSHRVKMRGEEVDALSSIKRARSFDELVAIFNPDAHGGASRYYKLNMTNLSPAHDERDGQIKTIEFRQHSATWEAEKSCAWIMLLQLFVEHFKRQREFPTPPAKQLSPAELLTHLFSTIRVPPILAEWWWNRASKLDQRRGMPRLVRVNTIERQVGYQGVLQTVQDLLGYVTSPIRSLYNRTVWMSGSTQVDLEPPMTPPRSREPPSTSRPLTTTPTTVQQPRRGRQSATGATQRPNLTVTANSSLDEIKLFIDRHELQVSKAVGGRARRTIPDIYNDIVEEFRRKYG